MASFNMGPHPRMMEIINATPGLKMAVPLTDFLEALRLREQGAAWKDLTPEGVSMAVWYRLYTAYEEDEREVHAKRSAEVERIERDRVSDNLGYFRSRG